MGNLCCCCHSAGNNDRQSGGNNDVKPKGDHDLTRILSVTSQGFEERASDAFNILLAENVLLFVHGFNTDTDGALKSAREILSAFPGWSVLVFHWSSQRAESLRGMWDLYDEQRQLVKGKAQELGTFLASLQAQRSQNVHILAHSMGSQIVAGAVQQAAGKVILAAPDLDGPSLEAWAQCGNQQITVYWNTFDLVLFISMVKNKSPRVGQTPNWQQKSNVAYVDCSGIVKLSELSGHSYFTSVNAVMEDIAKVFKANNFQQDARRLPAAIEWTLSEEELHINSQSPADKEFIEQMRTEAAKYIPAAASDSEDKIPGHTT